MRRSLLFLVASLALLVAFACGRERAELPFGTPTASPTLSPTPTPSATPALFGGFGYGDEHDGDLTITTQTSVNVCHVVDTAEGATVSVGVASGFTVGTLLLVQQAQDLFFTTAESSPLAEIGSAGVFELARITSVNGLSLTVAPPLAVRYISAGGRHAQACTVREYRDVTIEGSGHLIPATAWDGAIGGVVAFLAGRILRIDGVIDASGTGFRGGVPSDTNVSSTASVVTPNTTSLDGGGKGESLDSRARGLYGRGEVGNGGGGGNNYNGGGAGGGNGGAGGGGGFDENSNSSTGGKGGVAIATTGLRLVFGGGGGGGQQNSMFGGAGGAGGGIALLAGREVRGGGSILSDGKPGATSGAGALADGAGGGGAGGTILVIGGASSAFSGAISARGGAGGDVNQTISNQPRGAGGGGAGGRVVVRLPSGFAASALGEASGVNPGNDPHGALAGGSGIVDTSGNLAL